MGLFSGSCGVLSGYPVPAGTGQGDPPSAPEQQSAGRSPHQAEDVGKGRAFLYGVLSGIVEPLAAILTMLAAGLILPALPYLLGFAAGAMIYVVVEQLIPEASAGEHSNLGTLFFAAGFTIMLALDVALG